MSTTHLELNACTEYMHSHRGNGKLGLLCLTAQPEVIDELSSVKCTLPPNPVQHHTMQENTTGLQITNILRFHKEQFEEYLKHDLVDKALKSFLIAALDESCIRSLHHKHAGHAKVTTLQMITSLHDTHSRIMSKALKENKKRLHQTYDPSMPFETLIVQLEDTVDFAAAGKSPYTTKKIVTSGNNLIHETGTYYAYCKDWGGATNHRAKLGQFQEILQQCQPRFARISSHQLNQSHYNWMSRQCSQLRAGSSPASALEAMSNLAVEISEDK